MKESEERAQMCGSATCMWNGECVLWTLNIWCRRHKAIDPLELVHGTLEYWGQGIKTSFCMNGNLRQM